MNKLPSRKFMAVLSLFATAGLLAVAARAQGTAATKPAASGATTDTAVKMEAFVTTGSRLITAGAQADIPITLISKDQIDTTPVVEVADYLKAFPAFAGAGNTNDSSTNGGTGARFIDLRGLGSAYTLVLINGRRLSYQGTSGSTDVNQVPVTAVDHVEVLTSGASAVYGSEAIGGVVNIITRKGQNGGEINAYFGDTRSWNNKTNLDRKQWAFSFNASSDKIDVLVGGQYFKQGGIYSPDFFWSAAPGPTSNTYPFRMTMPNSLFTPGATGNSNYLVKYLPGEGGRRDAASPTDFRLYKGGLPNLANPDAGGDGFPFFLYTPLLRPEERYNFFTFTSYQLNDNVKVFGDLMYRYSFSHNQLAPAAVPIPALGAVVIPKTNYWNQKIFGANAVDITAGGWRMFPLGPRLDTAETTGIWFNGGVEGKVADWNWKLEGLFTQELNQFVSGNTTSAELLNQYLALTTPDALNPFSSKLDANTAIWNTIRRNAYVNDRSRLSNMTATVDGKMFDAPAGPVNTALTLEWNKLRAYSHPDALTQATPLGFNGTPNPTDGDRTQWGVSAEANVPVVAGFTARLAGRHDHYSDIGGSNVGQLALRYQPTKELLFRGSAGQGFLAPSILDLHEGPQVTNPTFIDPTMKNANGTWGGANQVSITRVGNPHLQPEKANMYNVGVAWSPQGLKGLTLSLDYWNIKQTDVVSTAENYAAIVAKRFWSALGSSDAARDAAARNPTSLAAAVAAIKTQTGVTVLWAPDGGSNGLGGLSQNDIAETGVYRTNLAGTKTDGFDFSANYVYVTPDMGTYTFDLKATYTQKFDYQALVGESFDHLAGMYSSSFEGAWPKWRAASVLGWNWKGVGVNATYHFNQRTTLEDGFDSTYNRSYLPSFNTWDFETSYTLPWTKTQLTLGVENAFNVLPPLTSFALNNFVPAGVGDVKGRYVYIRLSQKF